MDETNERKIRISGSKVWTVGITIILVVFVADVISTNFLNSFFSDTQLVIAAVIGSLLAVCGTIMICVDR